MIKIETVYFEEGGEENTVETLNAALKASENLGIHKIIVASTSGKTGVIAAELYKDSKVQLIVVGHQMGFPVPGIQQFKLENWEKIEELGGVVNLGTDVLTNSIRQRQKLGTSPFSILTQAYSAMKVKVNVEIVAKACDAGLVNPGEKTISVAGSHWGADTAVAFVAADSPNILDITPLYYIAFPLSREKADAEYMARRQNP
ncbi:hypothetical protein GF319_08025 [Candidatus Bathyarchaeota archaeon]|jgi:hypothetical protein|nr:hypothetical protein [Candidatus Bathyarchaeota archaeon]